MFDGLDEIDSNKFNQAVNEIKNFAVAHPNFHILVSCRENFNPFEAIEKDTSVEINDEFKICYLKEISKNDIYEYVQSNCNNPTVFSNVIATNQFVEVFNNPYYLVNAVEIYNSQNLIPTNRTEFFNMMIDQRICFEKDKNPLYANTLDEHALNEGLKILALTMQYSGHYKIARRNFDHIIRDRETRDAIKRIFFNKDGDEWRFEHNNFQEFLAAQLLSEKGWGIIKETILLKNGKLKPKWLNVYSYLINLAINENDFIEHFICLDAESLVKVEVDKLDKSTKDEIIIQIYNKHKSERTMIWKTSYSEDQLCQFCFLDTNEKIIDFLLSEINSGEGNIESIANAVHLLSKIKILKTRNREVVQVLLDLLDQYKYFTHGISYSIIESLSKWKMFDSEIKERLINNENLFKPEAPLSSLCHYLADGGFKEIKAELVDKLIESCQQQRVIGSEYSLYEVIKLLSHNELTRLIYLQIPTDSKNRERIWVTDLYKLINQQAIETYHPDSKIDNAITEFVYASMYYHDQEYGKQFKSFYEKTNLVEKSFKNCFLNDLKKDKAVRRELFVLPALIANKDCLDWVIDLYSENKITDENAWGFLIALSMVSNHENRKYIDDKLNFLSNNKFKPDPPLWDIFNKKRKNYGSKCYLIRI